MRIPKEIYNYINFELSHYNEYKRELEIEREKIIESTAQNDGQPRGNNISNTTQDKAIKLTESTIILSLERIINAIDKVLNKGTDTHRRLFGKVYIDNRKDVYKMCDELCISERTFQRYRSEIIYAVGKELGIIKKLA